MTVRRAFRRTAPGLAALAAAALLLAACGSSDTEQKGEGFQPPSEVTRTTTTPLIMPPDFGDRPEPTTPGSSSSETTVVEEQKPSVDLAALGLTPGETTLLRDAGVPKANPNIRQTLDHENAIFAGDPAFVDKLMFGDFPTGTQATVEQGAPVADDVQIQQQPADQGSWLDAITNFF